ncbi:zinc finger protein castor homolog 1 isoform X2 [Nilaparvata lugens]|uniref:zinc finger protein castor homolog 1 isoform X2 n=1 Tax=Nilaparvata lugens TaxID=108931 RepID=UPI00193CF09F|nr:zinc finger protein castor homolog 1 isoform X2 [Nilaparvata lugens]
MVNMAEAETGAAMFVQQHRLHANGMIGSGSDLTSDSEPDDSPPTLLYQQQQQQQFGGKRNKRKNFMPRNIAYSEEADEGESRDGSPLDLSGADCGMPPGGKRFRKTLLSVSTELQAPPNSRRSPEPTPGATPAPMDLSCGRSSPAQSDSESDASESSDATRPLPASLAAQQYLLHHAFLAQPADAASDLRDFAHRTVKELLEIYDLNSPEVAESITNNIPMSNFNSGKILESLSARALALRGPHSPGSQPPTPPRTPLSPHGKASSSPLPLSLPRPKIPGLDSVAAKFASSAPLLPNSRVSLPQNMATIFALAGLPDPTRPSSKPLAASSNSGSNAGGGVAPSPNPVPAHAAPQPNELQGGQMRRLGSPPRDNKLVIPIDYSRYVKRFGSALECGSSYCKELNYREHFHCLDCNSRVFVKKEEMIRHFKWHKKRDESLQHGFMRYSPSDDCSDRYRNCTHNRKQTHYHCIQGTCDKVYISTSDVQMHANYHRKDSAIIQEGFQRLRATEECRTPYCAFYGQRTTHFHCRRDHCQYTFKNKADMEKHKTYHIKDEQLARDGFKKFLKPDVCGFANCRFSQVCNHIHCVRDGCSYVLHSSGQLLSHKRKHERKDSEIAYRKFKLAQQAVVNISNSEQGGDVSPGSSLHLLQQASSSLAALTALHDSNFSTSSSEGRLSPPPLSLSLTSTPSTTPTPRIRTPQTMTPLQFKLNSGTPPSPFFIDQMTSSTSAIDLSGDEPTEVWPKFMMHCAASQLCSAGTKCSLYQKDHYHCREPGCDVPFRSIETAEAHARMHETQERVNENFHPDNPALCKETCPREKHFHCTWEGCEESVLPGERLDHLRAHEISAAQSNSLDALFRRKRGRPPKNRIIEAGGMGSDSPQAIFTSFKLPKPTPQADSADQRSPSPASESSARLSIQFPQLHGFQHYLDGCPDLLCTYSSKPQHYHCTRVRCFFATDNEEQLLLHSRDFHANVDILDGFFFFDKSVDCRLESCQSNKITGHFHCIHPGCGSSFTKSSGMHLHQAKHMAEMNSSRSPSNDTSVDLSSVKVEVKLERDSSPRSSPIHSPETNNGGSNQSNSTPRAVVKASGTFYPLCGLSNVRSSSPTSPGSGEAVVKSEPTTEKMPDTFPEWMSLERHEKYGPETSCSRPFCKLKRKEHYHCNVCNQAFSELERLRPHIAKHSPGAIPPLLVKPENNNNEETDDHPHPGVTSFLSIQMDSPDMQPPPPPPPPHYPGFSAAMAAAVAANQQLALITSQGIPFMPHGMPALYTSPSGLMFAAPPGFNPQHTAALLSNGLLESARNSSLDPSAELHMQRM